MDQEKLGRLRELDAEIMQLEYISSLLQWDEEILMPSKEIEGRSEQISQIQGLIYDRKTSTEMGELLDGLDARTVQSQKGVTDEEKALIRLSYRDYHRQEHIPKKLVTQLSRVQSLGQAAWARAREANSFADFQPHLEEIIKLKREWSDAVGFHSHVYDPLIDEYEPGMLTSDVDQLFEPLAEVIVPLVEELSESPGADDRFLYYSYPRDLQDRFGRLVLKDMGIDFERFSMTESVHPFTTTIGADDVRITTRYNEPAVTSALFSTIHEGGHALYELGASNPTTRGSIISQGASLSVHESQSRLWENIIGRSGEFWEHYFPIFKGYFPEQLEGVEYEQFLKAVNKVSPSCIRVNADEVTYSLHIILRFRLEKALAEGSLAVADLPAAWNDQMQKLLGICPEDDARGVLQDIHWSAGLFGYFPTYALGNLFAAQFHHTMVGEHPEIGAEISSGNLRPIQGWMHEHVHRHGSIYTARELLSRVTGKDLDAEHYSTYLQEKYRGLFGLS